MSLSCELVGPKSYQDMYESDNDPCHAQGAHISLYDDTHGPYYLCNASFPSLRVLIIAAYTRREQSTHTVVLTKLLASNICTNCAVTAIALYLIAQEK